MNHILLKILKYDTILFMEYNWTKQFATSLINCLFPLILQVDFNLASDFNIVSVLSGHGGQSFMD